MPYPFNIDPKEKRMSMLTDKPAGTDTVPPKEEITPQGFESIPMEEEKKTPLSFSEEQAVKVLDETEKKLDELKPSELVEDLKEPVEEPKEDKNKALDGTVGTPMSLESAMEVYGNNFAGLHQTASGEWIADETALSRAGVTGITAPNPTFTKAKEEYDTAKSNLLNLDVSKDPELQGIISSITSQWDNRISEMKQINKGREASLTKRGIRLGGRYTGEIFGGIIASEERAGIQKIANIEAQKQSAITQATAAYKSQKWDEYYDLVSLAEKEYNREIEAVNELNKLAVEQSKLLQEKNNEEISKSAVSDGVYNAIIGGAEDVQSIYKNLRDLGIETTPDEIEKMMISFIPEKSKDTTKNTYEFGKNDVGKLISVGLTGEDIQATQDVFNQYGLYGKVSELGNKSLVEFLPSEQLKVIEDILFPPVKLSDKDVKKGDLSYEQSILIPRIGKQIYGTRISDKESERVEGFVTRGMALGKNQYDIIDDVLGYQVERNKGLADGLRNTLLATVGAEGLFGYDMLGLARLINMGEDMPAVRKVENAKMLEAREIIGKENFVAEADIIYVMDKVDEINSLLGEGWIDDVGAFEGTFSGWISKKFGWGQAAKIKAKITSITSGFVNKRAGSAITDTEWERIIAPNVPALNDSADTIKMKLQELIDDPITRYNSERKQVSLPELTREQISTPELRIKLYSGNKQQQADNFLDSFDEDYDESSWGNINI